MLGNLNVEFELEYPVSSKYYQEPAIWLAEIKCQFEVYSKAPPRYDDKY